MLSDMCYVLYVTNYPLHSCYQNILCWNKCLRYFVLLSHCHWQWSGYHSCFQKCSVLFCHIKVCKKLNFERKKQHGYIFIFLSNNLMQDKNLNVPVHGAHGTISHMLPNIAIAGSKNKPEITDMHLRIMIWNTKLE